MEDTVEKTPQGARLIEHGPYYKKGTWRIARITDAGVDKEHVEVIVCPDCGSNGYLGQTHDVHPDGTVHPSVECPCGFHNFVKLNDYEKYAKKSTGGRAEN